MSWLHDRSTSARTALATSSVLAFDCATMPMLMPGMPLVRAIARSFSAARSTLADLAEPDEIAVGAAAEDQFAEILLRIEPGRRTQREFACCDSRRPAGSCTFSRRSALSMSPTVMPRAASACRSIQTRIA